MRRRAISAEGKWWSESQKIEAVQSYIILGSVAKVAAVTNIPSKTIANWKLQDWWKDMESEFRLSDDMELSARLKKTLDKSLEVVQDRLEQGDFVYNQKTGEINRKPVSMRDAHTVTKDLIDKRRLLENKPTHITETRVEDRLAQLAQQFQNFALSFKEGKQEKIIEGEIIDAGSEDFDEVKEPVASKGNVS